MTTSYLRFLPSTLAPLRSEAVARRPRAPWCADGVGVGEAKRRDLGRFWRRSGLTVDRQMCVSRCCVVEGVIFEAKVSCYSRRRSGLLAAIMIQIWLLEICWDKLKWPYYNVTCTSYWISFQTEYSVELVCSTSLLKYTKIYESITKIQS
jgi:hypothetical protein